jgi:hypothetical protein
MHSWRWWYHMIWEPSTYTTRQEVRVSHWLYLQVYFWVQVVHRVISSAFRLLHHSPCSFAPCSSKRKVPAGISGGSILSSFTHIRHIESGTFEERLQKCTRNHSPCSFAPCRSKRKVPARVFGGSVLSCFTHKALSNLECSKRGCRNAKGTYKGTGTYRYHRNIHSTNPSIRRHVLLTKTIQKVLLTSCNRKPKTRKNEDRSLCTHGGCRQCLYSLFHEHEKSSATIGTRRLFGSGWESLGYLKKIWCQLGRSSLGMGNRGRSGFQWQ